MSAEQWELRVSRRWGSAHAGYFPSREAAEEEAILRIIRAGEAGRIDYVDTESRIVYLDEHEEES